MPRARVFSAPVFPQISPQLPPGGGGERWHNLHKSHPPPTAPIATAREWRAVRVSQGYGKGGDDGLIPVSAGVTGRPGAPSGGPAQPSAQGDSFEFSIATASAQVMRPVDRTREVTRREGSARSTRGVRETPRHSPRPRPGFPPACRVRGGFRARVDGLAFLRWHSSAKRQAPGSSLTALPRGLMIELAGVFPSRRSTQCSVPFSPTSS